MNFNTFRHIIFLLHIPLFLALNKSNAPVSVSNKIDKSATSNNNTSENSKVSQVDNTTTNNIELDVSIFY